MDFVKTANLALRFVLELCALGALAYWGATAKVQMAGRIALAVAAPLTAAALWGLFVAPHARFDLGSVARLAVELVVFGTAIAALIARERSLLALTLGAVYVINRSLIAVWHQ